MSRRELEVQSIDTKNLQARFDRACLMHLLPALGVYLAGSSAVFLLLLS